MEAPRLGLTVSCVVFRFLKDHILHVFKWSNSERWQNQTDVGLNFNSTINYVSMSNWVSFPLPAWGNITCLYRDIISIKWDDARGALTQRSVHRRSGVRPPRSNFTVGLRAVCVLDAVESDPSAASKLLWHLNHLSHLRRVEFFKKIFKDFHFYLSERER